MSFASDSGAARSGGEPGRSRLPAVRDWPFARKLRGAVLFLLVISALGTALMLGYGRRSRALTRDLAARELAGLGLVLNVDRDGYQAVLGLTQAARAAEPRERARWLEFYRENERQTRARLDEYLRLPGLTGERVRAAREAIAARNRLAARGDALARRIGEGGGDDPAEVAAVLAELDAFRERLDGMETGHSEAGARVTAAADAAGAGAQWTGVLGLLAMAAAGLALAWVLDRAVREPVTRVADAARRIAAGDLRVAEVRVAGRDEVGEMAGAFSWGATARRSPRSPWRRARRCGT
jgi:HAMP domain-containing protein